MFEKVRALVAQKKSDRAIAKELGMDRRTVAKYRKSNTPPGYTPRPESTRVDPIKGFEDRVASLLKATPTLTAPEVFVVLCDEGYKGSLRTVQRLHTALKLAKPKERFFEQEYEPGEQAQFDFKEKVELPFVDGPRIVHLHFGTLPHSDFFHIKSYPFRNFEAFMDGIHSFFEKTGGMTGKIRFDNLAPCVKKVLKGSERLYTDAFKRPRHITDLAYCRALLVRAPRKATLSAKSGLKLVVSKILCRGLVASFKISTISTSGSHSFA
jgi:transposase